jgi:hypothetical protein
VLGRAAAARADSGAIEVAARTGTDGATYVFAVNTLTTPVQAQLHVPRLHDGAVQVFGEGRRVTAGGDNIGDMFRPLAVHVYVQR